MVIIEIPFSSDILRFSGQVGTNFDLFVFNPTSSLEHSLTYSFIPCISNTIWGFNFFPWVGLLVRFSLLWD